MRNGTTAPPFQGTPNRGCYGHQRTVPPVLFNRPVCWGSPSPDSYYYTTVQPHCQPRGPAQGVDLNSNPNFSIVWLAWINSSRVLNVMSCQWPMPAPSCVIIQLNLWPLPYLLPHLLLAYTLIISLSGQFFLCSCINASDDPVRYRSNLSCCVVCFILYCSTLVKAVNWR